MSTTPGRSLHLTLCDCPHVNLIIVDESGAPVAHVATNADTAEKIGRDLIMLAGKCRALAAADPVGVPQGRA